MTGNGEEMGLQMGVASLQRRYNWRRRWWCTNRGEARRCNLIRALSHERAESVLQPPESLVLSAPILSLSLSLALPSISSIPYEPPDCIEFFRFQPLSNPAVCFFPTF